MEQASFPDRDFQLWAYTVGMRRLLLRSTKSDLFPTRVDILFQNVKALKTPTSLKGITVRPPTDSERRLVDTEVGQLSEQGDLFILDSGSTKGYVIAGVMVTAEDEGEYNDESPLLRWP